MNISIVVLEYKSLDDICKYKDIASTFEKGEIIISSNSLYNNTKQEEILSRYYWAHWVFNEKNGGFAYGMNEGLQLAKGDFLIIANPDVTILSSIEPMVQYLREHPEVGLIAPKIVDEGGVIQDSFRQFLTPWGFFKRQLGWIKNHNELHVTDLKEPVHCDWVIGAFMMCRRDFYEKVGGLCDDYFMYCEDMDWCKRAHLAGYDVVYYPNTIVEYKGTRAARKSWKYAKIFLKSLITYWKKYGIK